MNEHEIEANEVIEIVEVENRNKQYLKLILKRNDQRKEAVGKRKECTLHYNILKHDLTGQDSYLEWGVQNIERKNRKVPIVDQNE